MSMSAVVVPGADVLGAAVDRHCRDPEFGRLPWLPRPTGACGCTTSMIMKLYAISRRSVETASRTAKAGSSGVGATIWILCVVPIATFLSIASRWRQI